MPTRDEIIQDLYLSIEISKAISKMQPAELRDDLKQEMFLVLCELSDEAVVNMYERKYLKYYLVRTMLNMMTGRRSTFANKFRQVFVEIIGDAFTPDEERVIEAGERNIRSGKDVRLGGWTEEITDEHHTFIENTVKAVNELHFYEAGLLKLYAEHNRNASEVARKTNIPYRSVYPVIREAKKKIQDKLKK